MEGKPTIPSCSRFVVDLLQILSERKTIYGKWQRKKFLSFSYYVWYPDSGSDPQLFTPV